MPEPCPLKVLLINDEEDVDDLRTPFLELVRVRKHMAGDLNRLASWVQHMELWSDGEELPEFDLVLIDINFKDDGDAPVYAVDGDLSLTPFGLLHALPLLARRTASRMPVVWRIHSGNPKAFKRDPVALWAFGMLRAMQGDDGWITFAAKHKQAMIGDYFTAEMDRLQVEKPWQVWRAMLPQFRERLSMACDEGKVGVDTNDLARCQNLAKQGTVAAAVELAEQQITFVGDRRYPRSIRSLFADLDTWTPDLIAEQVLPYIEELLSEAISWEKLYNEIVSAMNRIKTSDEENGEPAVTVNDAVPRRHSHRDLIKLGIIIFNYLELVATETPLSVAYIMEQMGYDKPSQTTVIAKRILANNGYFMTLEPYLEVLRTEPISHIRLRNAARHYWDKGMDERMKRLAAAGKGKYAPRNSQVRTPACIQYPTGHFAV